VGALAARAWDWRKLAEVQYRSRLTTTLAGTVSETAPSRITIMQRITQWIHHGFLALQAYS